VIANAPGIVTLVSRERIKYQKQTKGRIITLKLSKKGKVLAPLVNKGDNVVKNQIIASVVAISLGFDCDKSASEDYYVELLSSASLSKRYIAAKALGFFDSPQVIKYLGDKLNDTSEHIYIRLEAAASLARRNNSLGFDFIRRCLSNEYLQNRLEAAIVLGEIHNETSCKLLIDTLLNKEQHPEIRAGAAWALGELRDKLALNALIKSFTVIEKNIRIEAARALAKLAQRFTPEILTRFPQADISQRPGISWALSKAGMFSVHDMLNLLVDDDARMWVAYILGTQNQEKYIYEIEELRKRDPEVYFAVTVLWKIMTSWIWGLEEW
jgi:hypothetical protein